MARMGVKGVIVDGQHYPGDISIKDGVVDQIGLPPGKSGIVIPGFVDVQVNGFAGVDFTTATRQSWDMANKRLASTGVTTYLANIISNDVQAVESSLKVAREIQASPGPLSAKLAGVHLEGPFLSKEKAGIHRESHLREPELELLLGWIDAGPVAMTTIAPEIPGALSIISAVAHKGVRVSLGHSNSTSDEAIAGFDAGATSVTHIFNAMSGITARSPGLAGAALARDEVWLQLILDYAHVDEILVALLIKWVAKRLVLVTDCLPITGTSGTTLTLGGTEIQLVKGKAVNAEGVLAGSTLTMGESLRNAVESGMNEVDAINATSLNPLQLLDPSQQALLSPGATADLLVLSDSLSLEKVFVSGAEVEMQEAR